jgi:transposase-like protein
MMRAGRKEIMEKKEAKVVHVSKELEEMEGAHRATGISSSSRTVGQGGLSVVPDSEVPEKAIRRRFTAEYKRSILKKAESCKEYGQLGALLRREGLYSSNLITWRQQAERGTLEALSPKKRGPKENKPDPSLRRIAELEKTTLKLEHKLRQAELIIAAQKKIAEIFQTILDHKEETSS